MKSFIVRSKNALITATLLIGGVTLLFGAQTIEAAQETMVGQGPGPTESVPNQTTIHGDMSKAVDGTDVGDAWFKRTPNANSSGGETLAVDVDIATGVTAVKLCLSATPIKAPIATCANEFTGTVPAAGNELAVAVPASMTGKVIYAQVKATHNGGQAYSTWHSLATASGKIVRWWGNTQIPALGYTGPRDICPTDIRGRVLNYSWYANGTKVKNLDNLAGDTTAAVKFTIAPGCTQNVAMGYYFTPVPSTFQGIPDQILRTKDAGDFTQAPDVQNYNVNSLDVKTEDDCAYQIDVAGKGIVNHPTFLDIGRGAVGGKVDCRNRPKPTTTTSVKPTSTEKPTTTEKPTSTTEGPTSTTEEPTSTTEGPTTTTEETTSTTSEVTPTSEEPTSTTEETTSTTESTTTTEPATVLPTVITNTTVAPPAPVVQGETLAKTGVETLGLALIGGGLVSGGLSFRNLSAYRRRRRS